MKKFISLLIALTMLVSAMSITTFAAEIEGKASNDVVVNTVDKDNEVIEEEDHNDDIKKVYQVTVTWDSLIFTFQADQAAEELEWDPATQTYTNLTGSWADNNGRNVKLTNHSNVKVGYSVAFESTGTKSATKSMVTATISGTDGTLAKAAGTVVEAAPNYTYSVAVGNSDKPNTMGEFIVDTILVTISK